MLHIRSPKGLAPTGVGPRIILGVAPFLAVAVVATVLWPGVTRLAAGPCRALVAFGWLWLGVGVVFWVATIRRFLHGFQRGELVTSGTFGLCRNPLYATFVFFVLPAIAFIAESWAFLLVSVVGAALSSRLVRREEAELAELFGDEWKAYTATTGRLVPLPHRGRWYRGFAIAGWVVAGLVALCVSAAPLLPGCNGMTAKFYRELREGALVQSDVRAAVVTEADLEPLPPPVQRYMRFMGVVGKPRVWSLHVGFSGRFKPSHDSPWLPCETIQYNSRDELARLFYMTLHLGPVPMLGRDTYVRGRGRMLGRALDLFTVVDGSGPELDIGELVTYLNDGILMAPSMLLGSGVTWTAAGDNAFEVTLTDHGTSVRAKVSLDGRGAPVDFSTTDRFMEDPKQPGHFLRTRWTTPVEDWVEIGGRRLPAAGKAIWHPEGGEPLTYAEFTLMPETLAFNLAAGVAPAE